MTSANFNLRLTDKAVRENEQPKVTLWGDVKYAKAKCSEHNAVKG